MNLGKKYKKLFEGRKTDYFDKLNEAPMRQAFPKMKADAQRKAALEPGSGATGQDANTTGEFDYDYYIEQVEAVQETIEEMEYELLQTLDNLAEDEEVYGLVSDKAEQAANQVRRYINGAAKQLEGIQNLLDRSKRTKAFDQ